MTITVHGSHKLELFIDDIALLKKGSLIQNKEGLEFQQNHTLRIENYSEVFIGVEADDFAGLYNYLENIDLSFKIGNHPIEFSRVSPICCLLLEPYFSSKHYDLGDKGLSEYFYTLKILEAPYIHHEEILIKSLFHINSYYLKNHTVSFSVINILDKDYDEEDTDDLLNESVFNNQTENKADFSSTAPLILYNNACTQVKENRFLGFYRVLEFFFDRILIQLLNIKRFDESVSEQEIIDLVRNRNEQNMLFLLLSSVLSLETQKEIASDLNNIEDNIKSLSKQIYSIRNSIVHAKEGQIKQTKLPSIYPDNTSYDNWNKILQAIAEECIKELNQIN